MCLRFETKLDKYIENLVSEKINIDLNKDKYSIIYQEIIEITKELDDTDKYSICSKRQETKYLYIHESKEIYRVSYIYFATPKTDDITDLEIEKINKEINFISKYKYFIYNEGTELFVNDARIKVNEKGRFSQKGVYLDLSYEYKIN